MGRRERSAVKTGATNRDVPSTTRGKSSASRPFVAGTRPIELASLWIVQNPRSERLAARSESGFLCGRTSPLSPRRVFCHQRSGASKHEDVEEVSHSTVPRAEDDHGVDFLGDRGLGPVASKTRSRQVEETWVFDPLRFGLHGIADADVQLQAEPRGTESSDESNPRAAPKTDDQGAAEEDQLGWLCLVSSRVDQTAGVVTAHVANCRPKYGSVDDLPHVMLTTCEGDGHSMSSVASSP